MAAAYSDPFNAATQRRSDTTTHPLIGHDLRTEFLIGCGGRSPCGCRASRPLQAGHFVKHRGIGCYRYFHCFLSFLFLLCRWYSSVCTNWRTQLPAENAGWTVSLPSIPFNAVSIGSSWFKLLSIRVESKQQRWTIQWINNKRFL